MITYANRFHASNMTDGTVRVDFEVLDTNPPQKVCSIYMTRENALALSGLIVQVTEKPTAKEN